MWSKLASTCERGAVPIRNQGRKLHVSGLYMAAGGDVVLNKKKKKEKTFISSSKVGVMVCSPRLGLEKGATSLTCYKGW